MKPRSALALVVPLAGCVFHNPSYPSAWAPLARPLPNACAILTGTYADFGASSEPKYWTNPRLHPEVGIPNSDAVNPNRVALTYDDAAKALHVIAYHDDEETGRAEFSAASGTLDCSSDAVTVHSYHGQTGGRGNAVLGYEFGTTVLWKAQDGSLVVETSSGGFGLAFLVVPVGGTRTLWAHFAALAKS